MKVSRLCLVQGRRLLVGVRQIDSPTALSLLCIASHAGIVHLRTVPKRQAAGFADVPTKPQLSPAAACCPVPQVVRDEHHITATFDLHNKPVNGLWEWSKVCGGQGVRVGQGRALTQCRTDMQHGTVSFSSFAALAAPLLLRSVPRVQTFPLPCSPLLSTPPPPAAHPTAHPAVQPPLPAQVPEVHVLARAFVPSSSFITFRLAHGLEFVTFVNTVPIDANRTGERAGGKHGEAAQPKPRGRYGKGRESCAFFQQPARLSACCFDGSQNPFLPVPAVNIYALARKWSGDPTGFVFNMPLWDTFADRRDREAEDSFG